MIADAIELDCKFGPYGHMGILCHHVLKVMDYMHIKEIPGRHIFEALAFSSLYERNGTGEARRCKCGSLRKTYSEFQRWHGGDGPLQ